IAEFATAQIPVTGPFWGNLYDNFSDLLAQVTKDTSVMLLMIVIFAPLFEEIVFRGIVMKGLINKGLKPIYAIWISAIIFGAIHGNPWQFVGATFLGYVLGLVYYRTKSLLMPILLHAFNNAISSYLLVKGETESFADFFGISEYLVLAIGLVIFGVFYYLFTQKYKVHHLD
ncbi:MAG: CPBP family intramembrane metalloprotease, partial [Cruoricaptor ignavus]|nr:CPBP family intramembrane metalloprotease [Cruoricaptor ignavus]